ncbi:hypothetical protein [Agromyces sp. NPDC058126]|uniref:hypothetical protein n=1 Tax=Agromyces sp. NPDC058126 TaxID=3346350 RepID=UPI0036DA9022
MNTASNTPRRRVGTTAVAFALLAGVGLAGCSDGAAPASEPDRGSGSASVATVPLDVQRARNLLVNDDDPRGLHGDASSGVPASVDTDTEEVRPGIRPAEPHGLRSDPTLTKLPRSERRTVNDDDPRGLHDLPTNGW